MKRFILIGVAMASFAVAAFAAAPQVLIDPQGGFALQVPEGWTVEHRPGVTYQALYAPAENEFSPNINVVDEAFTGNLDEYLDRSLETIKKNVSGFQLISRSRAELKSGAPAVRILIGTTIQNVSLRQIVYLTDGDNKKFVITCTALEASNGKFDEICDNTIKTFAQMFVEPTAGFAIQIPLNWTVRQQNGTQYKMMVPNFEAKPSVNINVFNETSEATIVEYVDGTLKQLSESFKEFKLISRDEIVLNSSASAIHLLFTIVLNGEELRYNMYLTSNASKKFSVICATLSSNDGKFDKVCEDTAKTLTIINQTT